MNRVTFFKSIHQKSAKLFFILSLRVFINGVEQQKGFIYEEDSDNAGFTLLRTPLEADGLGADDILWVHYDIDITGEK